MKEEIVKVADLVTPESNTRIHPEKQIDELCKSYKMFGQFRPLIVDENNMVWAGNGLLQALKKMGVETATAYRVTGMTETQKKKLMLADNKTFSLGFDNLSNIDEVMKSLDDFEIPGYDADTLSKLYSDIDEVMGDIENYGTMQQDDAKAIMQEEAKEQERVQSAVAVPAQPEPSPAQIATAVEAEPLPKQEVRKFVICPKCGEKVWL